MTRCDNRTTACVTYRTCAMRCHSIMVAPARVLADNNDACQPVRGTVSICVCCLVGIAALSALHRRDDCCHSTRCLSDLSSLRHSSRRRTCCGRSSRTSPLTRNHLPPRACLTHRCDHSRGARCIGRDPSSRAALSDVAP